MDFLVGIIRTQCGKNIRWLFFFWVWVFLWGWVTDFVTHLLILIVKVHKMSWIYIQVSSYDYYTSFGFWKYYIYTHVILKKKWKFFFFYWFLWIARVVWNNDEFVKNFLNFFCVLFCIPNSLAIDLHRGDVAEER